MPDLAVGQDAALTPLVDFIVDNLAKVIDPDKAEPVVAIAETAVRFMDTAWFWVDDTAKTAELFAVPSVHDAHPALADATLDYVLRLSRGPIIQRRSAVPDLKLINSDPENFHAYNNFFHFTGNLTRGIVSPSIRYNDDRTRAIGQYSGNLLSFRYGWRDHVLDIEEAIDRWSVDEREDRIVFSHISSIRAKPLVGDAVHVCDVTYAYTLWRARPTVELSVSILAKTTLEDVRISTAFDHLWKEPGFGAAIVGRRDSFITSPVPTEPSATLWDGPADYLCLYESSWMPGFANGFHVRFKDPAKVERIMARWSEPNCFHWVYAVHKVGKIRRGQTRSIVEDRLMTGGGNYDAPAFYRELVAAAEAGAGDIDPSVSYDIGAELNAAAVTILFAREGRYAASPPSPERIDELRAWYDRHLDIYLKMLRIGEPGDASRVFVRGLSFVILSLDCMARAFPEAGYRATLGACVKLLLRREDPVRGAPGESIFGPPELDCHTASLLAFARAAHWGDPDRVLSQAIERGLRAIAAVHTDREPNGNVVPSYDTLLVRDDINYSKQDSGFWNFKLGLSLRAFNAIRRMQELGKLSLDWASLDHLDTLDRMGRAALQSSMRRVGDTVEVLTSHRSTETNSETQPWVALGLTPAIEWEILGRAVARASAAS